MTFLIGMTLSLAANTASSDDYCSQAKYEFVKGTLHCQLEVISWVEVNFEGELLKKNKLDYERLVRLRLKNDLSMVRHETLKFNDAMEKYEYDFESQEMRKRGYVTCLVWTLGDEYPVAEYVECKLEGYGDYTFRRDFSSRMLGYSDSSRANEQVRSMIRQIVTDISSEFLEARDGVNQ